jgi:hypothetical protein
LGQLADLVQVWDRGVEDQLACPDRREGGSQPLARAAAAGAGVSLAFRIARY